MTHHHACAVPGCDRPVVCSGYAVGSRYDHDLHCICEEGNAAFLCADHEDHVYCGGCGKYVPALDIDGECPDCAADTHRIPFDVAWPARPVSV